MRTRSGPLTALLFAALLGACASADTHGSAGAAAEKRAPSFQAHRLDGTAHSFDPGALQKPTLFAFWASWCTSCVEEMPALLDFYRDQQGKLDLIGVSVDKDPHRADQLARSAALPYANLDDADLAISDLFTITSIPAFILVDRRGQIAYSGRAFDAELRSAIAQMQ